MAFLGDDDYDVQARNEIMQVLQITTSSRGLAENMAEEEITAYLRPRGYDVPAIFAQTGDARNPLIIMYMIDIVIYHLHSNTATRVMPKTRADRYTAAIDWLTKVNAGDLDPSLPKIPDTTPDPLFRLSSDNKYFSRW